MLNIKKSPKLAVMHNISIVKKSNSWTMDDTHNFNGQGLPTVGAVYMEISPQTINLQTELIELSGFSQDLFTF